MPAPDSSSASFAVFFDRDGTLIHDPGYLHEPDKVVLLSGVAETLRSLKDAGAKLFLHTNQSGPARGMFPMSDVIACNERMEKLVGIENLFDEKCIAAEPPDEPGGYRKPSPRFILEAIAKFGLDPAKCIVVGDKRRDLESAVAAGVKAIRIAADADSGEAAAYAESCGFSTIMDFRSLPTAIEAALDIQMRKAPGRPGL